MPICLHALTNGQLNQHLEARGARTSGSRRQKEERLQRFLDFENQKERRNRYVQEQREAINNAQIENANEMDGQQDQDECCETCECNQARAQTEEERVARALLDLRDDAERSEYYINHLIPRVTVLDESYHAVVAENLRLNNHIENLELRLSHMENRLDSPPPLIPILQDSNPNWHLDASFYV